MPQENTLARYEVLRELGRGAISAVYSARDRSSGGLVALKTLDPALSSQPDLAERFLRHARSAQRLTHRNIARIHDVGAGDGIAYVAMEMLEGESLRKILDKGPLPVTRAIRIARDIASALAHAHLEGVVHGGLRPSNVIVSRTGKVTITDLGVAQLGEAGRAPEQIRGEPVDHRCDIFALGAMLYEMLTHRTPFGGNSPEEIRKNILHVEPQLPSQLNPHVPPALDPIVFRMLVKHPDHRLPGAPVLQQELQQIEDGLGLATAPAPAVEEPAVTAPPAEPAIRRRPPRAPAAEAQSPNRAPEHEAFDHQQAILMMEREARLQRPSGSRPSVLSAVALILATIAVGLSGFMYYSSTQEERPIVASRTPEAPAAAPSVAPPSPRVVADLPAPAPAPAPEPVATTPVAPEPAPLAKAEERVTPVPERKASAIATPASARLRQVRAVTEEPKQQPGAIAQLVVAVRPRGEVYIDGEYHGTAPQVTTFDLEPGMHRIEVRNASRKPYLTYVTVQAGDVRRIRHDFNAKRGRPPR